MSVYKSQQRQSAVKYVSEARNFRVETIRTMKHFPNSYRYIFVNKILDLASDIYINCCKANSIFVHKNMPEKDFELRHRYLMLAYSGVCSLLCEISFCYDYVNLGNNFFKDGYDYGKRFEQWTKSGNAVLQFDFKNYFASLPHDNIKDRIDKVLKDSRLKQLLYAFVDDFKRMGQSDGSPVGVGLGSEVSQIIALDYASPIDHYIKDICGIKGYGRYMDDGYIISDSLERLKTLLSEIKRISDDMGICLSAKKCIIVPFRHHAFHFLKMRVFLTDTGKVLMKINKRCIKSMHRKIRIFYNWVRCKRISFADVYQSYQSWRAHAKRCNCYHALHNMDLYFGRIFHAVHSS